MRNALTTLPDAEYLRPWYKRLTLICGIGFAALQYAEAQGLVPAGLGSQLQTAAEQIVALAQTLLGVGTLVGLYRQVAK